MSLVITSPVLVLNRSFLPLKLTTLRRALCMLYTGIARAVDEQYRTFDFKSWSELSQAVHAEKIGLVGQAILVPRVVALTYYDRLPRRNLRFSRLNILIRDKFTCQYCGQVLPRLQLNLDHVVPRSLGGQSVWENVVSSCVKCNLRKGGRLPEVAGMHLIRKPFRPTLSPLLDGLQPTLRYEQWKPFLNVVDYSYWNVELEK